MTEPLTSLALRAAAIPSDISETLSQVQAASSVSGSGTYSTSSGPSAPQAPASEAAFQAADAPEPAAPATPALPASQKGGKKTVLYMLAPALAFMATFNLAPVLAPDFFVATGSNKTDRRKLVLASSIAAVAAFLAVRCVA